MADRKYPTQREIADAIVNALNARESLSFDALGAHATKITRSEYPIPAHYIRAAIHFYRKNASPGDAMLIVDQFTWRYSLTTDPDAIRTWLKMREHDTETRAGTMLAAAELAVSHTNGRSTAGKRARIEALHLGRLVEDLAALAEAVA